MQLPECVSKCLERLSQTEQYCVSLKDEGNVEGGNPYCHAETKVKIDAAMYPLILRTANALRVRRGEIAHAIFE